MSDFKSILPINTSKLLKDLEETSERAYIIKAMNKYLHSPDNCPEHILPWLAWAVSVDVWDEKWAVEIRRNVIKASVFVHRKKGTIGALKKALSAFNFDSVLIEEWFETGGTPYTFKVFIENMTQGFDILDFEEVFNIIHQTKNARSHLTELAFYLTCKSDTPNITSALIFGETATFYPERYMVPRIALSLISGEITIINP